MLRCDGKSHSMSEATRLVTAEDLEKFPDDDFRYELVDGRVVCTTPVGVPHGRVVIRLGSLLDQHVRSQRLGLVLTEVGFKLKSKPDTVRGPDLAFIRRERIPAVDPKGFWHGPPDLAVEVVSPDDTKAEIAAKTAEYLSAGVHLAVVVDPEARTVSLFDTASHLLRSGNQDLDLGRVIAGFRCTVDQIFE